MKTELKDVLNLPRKKSLPWKELVGMYISAGAVLTGLALSINYLNLNEFYANLLTLSGSLGYGSIVAYRLSNIETFLMK